MRIYVGHSSAFDYESELYQPIKNSKLYQKYNVILPHDSHPEPLLSKDCITTCDLLIAEVSYPSTGLGIELGWADLRGCDILYLHKENTKPSASLSLLSPHFISYRSPENMIAQLEKWMI